jgi:beta-phosphoglucomutase family hydrolase
VESGVSQGYNTLLETHQEKSRMELSERWAEALHPPADVQGVIFDCDGTLADTMPLHYRAWADTLASTDVAMSEAMFYELGGVGTEEIVRLLNAQHASQLPVAETAAQKERRYEELLPEAPAIRPVVTLVRSLHGKLPLAVASGGIRRLVEKTLAALELTDCFQAIMTIDDVTHGKPAPDMFLRAAEALGVPPQQCLVYEDSDLGLEAARRAGMRWVDVRPIVEAERAAARARAG